MKSCVRITLIVIFMLTLAWSPQVAKAQAPDCEEAGGAGCIPQDPGSDISAQAVTGFKTALNTSIKGGYVAHGIGMRNQGYGTIVIGDVPANSTVTAAYLFWAVAGPKVKPGFYYYKGTFAGHPITGSLIGSSAGLNWGANNPVWTYRANVRSWVAKAGNGSYTLTGFASGLTNGEDPWTGPSGTIEPLAEGATLVIVYSNAAYPLTRIQIYNGAATTRGSELHLNMPGLKALAPTGFAYTTFIGADGQNNAAKLGGFFFTQALPTAQWLGKDPNAAGNFTYGNLWDTMTVDLHSLVEAPEPDFWVSINTGIDVVTWVAQVVAYSSGSVDTDGDGLKDGWELNGYDGSNGFVDLPGYGANPLHKDLFVESDYMVNGAEDHLPNVAQMDDIVSVFNNAPVKNPDGTTGIHIHIDTGGAAHGAGAGTYARFNLGGGNSMANETNIGTGDAYCNYDWSDFQSHKNTNMNPARLTVFHYMIFADNLPACMNGSSGISRNGWPDSVFVKGASDFIVSMGTYWGSAATSTAREGTFIHELGHNLGLRHGGNDHKNYKPNYLSIMNYAFQIDGVYRSGRAGNYDYSRFLLPSLNENKLNEVAGLGPLAAGYGTEWYDSYGYTYSTTDASNHVDWNANGDGGNQTNVKANINYDGIACGAYTCHYYSVLGTQNNWASITFKGGGLIGATVSGGVVGPTMVTFHPDELTLEEYLQHKLK